MTSTAWILLAIVVAPLVALFLAIVWVRFWRTRLTLPDGFDEISQTRTADGAIVRLARLRPKGTPSQLPPVVLCHGLAMNRLALAFDAEHSLAHMLAARGRDCWLLELRGASHENSGPAARSATFDTYLTHDVPTALAHVRAATDAPDVDWVGFSMGGMLAYAHLGAMQGDGIRRLVTLGSPVAFKGHGIAGVAGAAPYVFTPMGLHVTAPLGFLIALVAPLAWPGLPLVLSRGLRGRHYSASTLRRIMASAFSDVPAGVMKQFARWVRNDVLTRNDGTYDYRESLSAVTVPTLVIAGDRDRLALPPCVREAYERCGAQEKRYLEVGVASGASDHYDHLDLVMGHRAHDEVFSHVIAWLDRKS
jgi:pimeloyl-ACP methyl ester carboxylesterase